MTRKQKNELLILKIFLYYLFTGIWTDCVDLLTADSKRFSPKLLLHLLMDEGSNLSQAVMCFKSITVFFGECVGTN